MATRPYEDILCEDGYCGVSDCRTCLENENVTDIKTEVVMLPFYREILPTYIYDCIDEPKYSYDSYDLFSLRTRLIPYVYSLSPTYRVQFLSCEFEDKMRVTVELYDGAEFIPFTPETAASFREHLAKLIPRNDCFFFSANIPLRLESTEENVCTPRIVSRSWLLGILPYISLPENYSMFIEDGNVYITLDREGEFESEYELLYNRYIETVGSMYRSGVILCHGNLDRDFIIDWDLEPYIEIPTDMASLYYPKWRDDRFACNIIFFLQRRLMGESRIRMHVGDSNVVRHHVAKKLYERGVDFYFSRFHVYVPVANLEEARSYADIIERAQNRAHGTIIALVTTGIIETEAEMRRQYPTSQVVVYKVASPKINPLRISVLQEGYDNIKVFIRNR